MFTESDFAWFVIGVMTLVCGIVAGLIGRSKGIGSTCFMLGVFLGCLGIPIALLLKGDSLRRIRTRPGEKGWHTDPLGRFERRYFDGKRWTPWVQRRGPDGRLQRYEDPG